MKAKIYQFLEASDIPLSPFSISESLEMNPSSVRARLAEMAKRGEVERITWGLYQYVPRYGVGRPGRIQNFLATAQARPRLSRGNLEALVKRGILEERRGQFIHVYEFQGPPEGSEGMVRQTLQLGLKRNKITWRIKAALGLDYYGLMFAYALMRCTLARLGLEDLDFMVINHEYLEDKISIKIEGAASITWQDFRGNLEKIYNKTYGARRETRDTSPRPVNELLALYGGGLPQFMISQGVYDVARKVEQNSDNIGRLAHEQHESNKINQEILRALWRLIDRDEPGKSRP